MQLFPDSPHKMDILPTHYEARRIALIQSTKLLVRFASLTYYIVIYIVTILLFESVIIFVHFFSNSKLSIYLQIILRQTYSLICSNVFNLQFSFQTNRSSKAVLSLVKSVLR